MKIKSYRIAMRSVLISYLLILVILPISAVYENGFSLGWGPFWKTVSGPIAWSAILLTFKLSILTTLIQAIIGTFIAFVLIRYQFLGKSLLNSFVDLPFSLPTAVSGLMLLTLLGPLSPIGKWLQGIGVDLLYNQAAIVIGMVFITFPFVIRTVQPMIEQIDPYEEQVSYTLGAGKVFTFFKILLPSVVPGILAGSMLTFSRALSEFGAISLISGNLPGKTQVASVYIYGEIENFNTQGAAAVSIVLVTISLIILLLVNIFQKRRGIQV
ncbi:sulfate ABC transporter permease subunit CysT [Neobacillus cucumis]|uniref:sulfate ABC transporter permease subunit CysT n=1 Tax=Neobacillus cucumis TaxID=1740721 RepID=UPI0028532B83|nr:sulfate ABC transporter permease subunit CysT [Neobacillus cucumis]MDR4945448.1 sulfate ABC transporter permease subunit CysT [Neobacillus cucumis]